MHLYGCILCFLGLPNRHEFIRSLNITLFYFVNVQLTLSYILFHGIYPFELSV